MSFPPTYPPFAGGQPIPPAEGHRESIYSKLDTIIDLLQDLIHEVTQIRHDTDAIERNQ